MSVREDTAAAVVEQAAAGEWRRACERQAQEGRRFCALYAGDGASGLHVNAVFAHRGRDHVVRAHACSGVIDTLVDLFPACGQDEREAHDCYGVRFDGHEPLRALVAHPEAPEQWTVPVNGHDPYQVAVGPIHAGIIESGHFRFAVVGERILHLDLRLFYKHRGLQRAAEGHELPHAIAHAQRSCAACAVTNTVAFAQACESALALEPDENTRRARTLLLELERLYNHLNDISAVCAGVGFAPGAMAFAALKERAHRLNQQLTGHRFLFNTIALAASGLRLRPADILSAREQLRELGREQQQLWRQLRFAASVQDRLAGVGRISHDDALRLGAVGPAARAAGIRHDTRSESPRLCYRDFTITTDQTAGDVMARLDIRQTELCQTLEILDGLLSRGILPGRARRLETQERPLGLSRVESPRGETVCVIEHDCRQLTRMQLRTGSYANWPVLAHAVRENLLPDFPLINKSFELCYACMDR